MSAVARKAVQKDKEAPYPRWSSTSPGFKAFIDSMEHEISRPKKSRARRKSHYWDKKKKRSTHTVKKQVMVNKGADKDFPTVRYALSVKKNPAKKEKRYNRKLARERVAGAHAIARIKYGIMGTRFRNNLKHYDWASSIVSGLVNVRIMRAN